MNIKTLFNDGAEKGAQYVDSLIESGNYHRGKIFLNKTVKYVPFGAYILDYGCGHGRISRLLVNKGYQIFGIDLSEKLIKEARKQKLKNAEFYTLEKNQNNFGLKKFDSIICSSVIEFIPDADLLLNNFYEILAQDGYLIISFANKNSIWRYYAKFRYGKSNGHFRFQKNIYTFKKFHRLLKKHRFQICENPQYFESAFDQYKSLGFLSSLKYFGTLGIVVAKKVG